MKASRPGAAPKSKTVRPDAAKTNGRTRKTHTTEGEVKTRGRRRKEKGTEGAQELILDAAEELFAKHGFYGVTLLQVAQTAGVDTALLHYYFGNKRGLFDQVFGRRAEILNRLRMESLDRYESEAGDNPTLEGVVDAFIRPLIDTTVDGGPGWRNYFALVAQVNNAPEWGGATMTHYFDSVIQRFIDLLHRLLPDAPMADIYWSFQQLTGAITLTLSQTGRIDRLSGGLCRSRDLREAYARMVPYAVGGLRNVGQLASRGAASPAAPKRDKNS